MADPLADALALRALRFAGSLEYDEDFTAAWNGTLRDPVGRAALTRACQQAQVDGQNRGGQRCCGTLNEWHRPWCETGPHRYSGPGSGEDDSHVG